MLTGIPPGVVPGFQNYTGPTQADLLRLNMAIPATSKPSNLGLIGGDPAGYPNGRRVFDDVVTIEVRAIAGVTLPLVDTSYTPDAAAGLVTDGLTSSATDTTADGNRALPFLVPVPRSSAQRVREPGRMSETAESPRAPVLDSHVCETAVLDIGGDTGALIIYADEKMVGEEIEICRPGDLRSRCHNVVRARRVRLGARIRRRVPGALRRLLRRVGARTGSPCREANVAGGRVTEIDCCSVLAGS